METSADIIELILPLKAEYVSIARLTVSGIANRMGFDIEIIEDIKVAVSEVCSKYVQKGSSLAENFKIIFSVSEDCLKIAFNSEDKSLKCIFSENDDEFAISILNALMDEVQLCINNDEYLLTMSKYLERKM